MDDSLDKVPFRNEYHRLIANIYCTNNFIVNNLQASLEQYDLTLQQFKILRILRHHWPGSLMMRRIKECMIDKNPDITRITDRLMSKNLVQRESDPENRRVINLKLTEEAIGMIEKIERGLMEIEALINLSEEEVTALNQLLNKIRLNTK